MGDLSNFERGQTIGLRLAGASMIKSATSLVVSRVTVSKATSAYKDHEKTTSAQRNNGRKSILTERDRHTLKRILSKNHRITAAQVTGEQN
jgi:transposase